MKYGLLLLICLTSCQVTAQKDTQNAEKIQTNQPITQDIQNNNEVIIPNIPKATWEEIYFEGINERTDEAKIKSLRNTNLAKDDLEIRVWMGFGITKLQGFILKRINNSWSAIKVDADYVAEEFVNKNIKLDEPKEGWNQTWQKLIDAEILTLPDAESINCNAGALDGFSYVFEIKKGENYRTYMYDNPSSDFKNKCKEAEKVMKIVKMILQDYNLK